MNNNVATWLWLIGTKENALKLRVRLTGLKSPPLDPGFGPEPLQCPLTVLYGAEASRQAYANLDIRPALDSWDTGEVTPDDLRRWCLTIEKGDYVTDSPFDPKVNAGIIQAIKRAMAFKLVTRDNNQREPRTKVVDKRKKFNKPERKEYKPIDWSLLD